MINWRRWWYDKRKRIEKKGEEGRGEERWGGERMGGEGRGWERRREGNGNWICKYFS